MLSNIFEVLKNKVMNREEGSGSEVEKDRKHYWIVMWRVSNKFGVCEK